MFHYFFIFFMATMRPAIDQLSINFLAGSKASLGPAVRYELHIVKLPKSGTVASRVEQTQ